MADLAIDSSPGLPAILYRNLFRMSGATVTASSEETGFEASQAYDWLPHTSWLPTAGGASTLVVSFSEAKPADALGIFDSNLYSNGAGSVKVEYSQDGGSTYTTAAEQNIGEAVRAIIWLEWTKVYARHWKVTISSTTASNIPVLCLGELMRFYGGMKPGSVPPLFAREVKTQTNRSIEGTFLGRSVERYGVRPKVMTVDVPESWVASEWMPFVIHAEKKPFFFQPNFGPHVGAKGAALCWVPPGSLPPPAYVAPGFCSINLPLIGQTGAQQEELDDA